MKKSGKSVIRNLHLYLGLASGLLIVFVCLTGTLLVFEHEIEQRWHPERYFVRPAPTPALPLAQLTAAVRTYRPKATINSLKVYADPSRTVEIGLAGRSGPGQKPRGKGKGQGKSGSYLYLNPYTAAVMAEVKPGHGFFHTVEQLHRGLVAGKTGKLVMGVNAVIFLLMLLTGLVLWWPATRRALTARLRVKWDSSGKRRNHDLHVVLGFYTAGFLLIMAFTGVGMSFDWVGAGINKLTNSPLQRPEPPVSVAPPAGTATLAPAAALAWARRQAPAAVSYSLQLPLAATGSMRVAFLRVGAITENATDEVFLDQYSGRVLRTQTYEQRPVGQRIRGLFKPVHTGAISGWPSKILALIVSLLGAMFPITGTLMWLNRRRKSRKQSPPLQAVGS